MEIPKAKELEKRVFAIHNEKEFHSIALNICHFQFHHNPVYQQYCKTLKKSPGNINALEQIPFLPISFFKTHIIKTTSFEPELVFKSSGTTGSQASTHFVKSAGLYRQSFEKGFRNYFGDIDHYCILALLPSYLEKGQSSLVYMADHLIQKSGHPQSGFYLYEFEKLDQTLKELENTKQKTVFLGVSYALLDFCRQFPQQLSHTILMETGGMKGRKQELTKTELYEELKKGFGVNTVYSEYGMTELLSQAYSVDGFFRCPPWMKILIRDETDPFAVDQNPQNRSGAINIIDLANLYSCSFIATDDAGRGYANGEFEILGRMDHSDIRGCSLMVYG